MPSKSRTRCRCSGCEGGVEGNKRYLQHSGPCQRFARGEPKLAGFCLNCSKASTRTPCARCSGGIVDETMHRTLCPRCCSIKVRAQQARACMLVKFFSDLTTKPKETKIMEMIYEKKKLLVHPTRMPITTQEVSDAICTVQRRCGFKAGEAGRWSAQAWDYLFKFLGRCKPVRNRMICSGAGFGTIWPQSISNAQEADSRKPFLLDEDVPDMVSLERSLGLPTGCL